MSAKPMSISRAFLISFVVALVVEVIICFTSPLTPLSRVMGWVQPLCLVLLGVLLGRAGHSYKVAFVNAWPFALLWALVAYWRVTFLHSDMAADTLQLAESHGWWIYLTPLVITLPFALASAAVGIWIAKRVWPFDGAGEGAA